MHDAATAAPSHHKRGIQSSCNYFDSRDDYKNLGVDCAKIRHTTSMAAAAATLSTINLLLLAPFQLRLAAAWTRLQFSQDNGEKSWSPCSS